MKKYIYLGVLMTSLGGCAYEAPVAVSPNLDVYSSYSEKLPGSYALYVSADNFDATVRPTGLGCSYHNYPVHLANAFKPSVIKTIQQLVENIEIVDHTLTEDEIKKSGKRGMIVVKGDTLNARILFVPGFWSQAATSDVELSASLTVDTPSGRALGTEAEGSGNGQADGGQFCEGGATAISRATEKAMKHLLGQLGERLSNAQKLRAIP